MFHKIKSVFILIMFILFQKVDSQDVKYINKTYPQIPAFLGYVENEIIGKWLHGWCRKNEHFSVCRRFMTKWGSNNWEAKYCEAIQACVDDAVSAFLYLLYRDYRKTDRIIEFQTQTSLKSFL